MKEIRRSQYVTELQELESILKESGIDAKIVEYNGDLFNSTGSAVMFSLYVEDDDAERAAAIAAKCNPDNSKGVTYCRECGSENITKEVVRKRLPVYFLAIGLVVCAAGFSSRDVFCRGSAGLRARCLLPILLSHSRGRCTIAMIARSILRTYDG